MRFWKSSLALAVALALTGCDGDSSSSSSKSKTLSLPGSIDLVDPDDAGSQSQNQAAVQSDDFAEVSNFEADGTDYSNFSAENIQIDIAGDQAVDYTNNILCFIDQMTPQDNIDTGKYVAMVEEGRCFGGNTRYQSVTANVTTTTEGFQIELLWNDSSTGENRVRVDIEDGVSAENPFGLFDMYMTTTPSGGTATQAYVAVDQADNGQVALAISVDGPSDNMQSYAQVNSTRTSGAVYTVAGTDNVRMAFDGPYIESSVNSGPFVCRDKSNTQEQVFGYTLFYKDAATNNTAGQEVEVNSGIFFTYTDSGNDTRSGFISDWGYWSEETLTAGDTTVTGSDGTEYILRVTVNNNITTAVLRDSADTANIQFGGQVDFGTPTIPASADRNGGTQDYTPLPNNDITYFGRGSMGLFSNGTTPAFSMADSTELTSSGVTYVVKATDIVHVPQTASAGSCDDLDPQDMSENLVAIDDLEASLFPTTDFTESDAAPKYINGELQTGE